jgi:DNA mismatch repair protein MutS
MPDTDHTELAAAAGPPATADEFLSILFEGGGVALREQEPDFFADLNLDQTLEAIVANRDEYDLKPFFYTPLREVSAVEYRNEVFRDLAVDGTARSVRAFGDGMRRVRQFLALASKQHYAHEKQRWFLDAARTYCEAVVRFRDALGELGLGSRGLQAVRGFLAAYTGSDDFASLAAETRAVREGLDRIRYTMRIKGGRVTVSRYRHERDYSAEVDETFARFSQGAPQDHLIEVPDPGSMDSVEARVVELVARLHRTEFDALADFCERRSTFVDPRVARFDREVQFYLAYLEHMERVVRAGASFSYPTVSLRSKEISAEGAYDIALAAKLEFEGGRIVCNDVFLRGEERILVVTGPNQGGKTTFARMFGQLHYLASLGVPVPARAARLPLPDRVFTHFEREEDIRTLRGKLDDELVRIREILAAATEDSVVVLNEAFASTTLGDAVYLGTEILKRLVELDCLAVWVTFIDELASIGAPAASMVATVAPDDPSVRTFEVVRRAADGRAYAWALADKYGLSYERLKARMGG